jgi:deoxyribonuclease-4
MSAKLLGAHCSAKGGLGNALRLGKQIGCAAIQVFTSSPQQWYAKPVTNEMVFDFKEAQKETGITSVVSHDSYLVNLCAPTPDIAEKSYKGLYDEIFRCALYGIPYVVSHMGSAKGQPESECLVRVGAATNELLDETPETVTLLMETTAGQGSSLNACFEELAVILEECKGNPRLCVCLDTCHVFAAGYDIRTPETFAKTFSEFDRIVGFDRLKVVHCNDSKRELGSRIDRHEHIGLGTIGDEGFRCLVTDSRFENIPILLETEAEGHEADLAHLRSLAGAEVGAGR